jgi:hypothetical protein
MASYNGKCHCGQTEWKAELKEDQQGHILWYVDARNYIQCIAFLIQPQ